MVVRSGGAGWRADVKITKFRSFGFVEFLFGVRTISKMRNFEMKVGARTRKFPKTYIFFEFFLDTEKTPEIFRIYGWRADAKIQKSGNFRTSEFSNFRNFAKTDGQPIFEFSNFCDIAYARP